jgi:hypothetical protein
VALGWVPEPFEQQGEIRFSLLLQYQKVHGHVEVPQADYFEGFALGRWVSGQRQKFRNGSLPEDRKNRLSQIQGWRWDASELAASSISKRGLSPSKLKRQVL